MSRVGREASGSEGGSAFKEETAYHDIEHHALADSHLRNTTVHSLSWHRVNVTVKDRETKQPKVIVDNVEGYVEAGQLLALMGPSGCGKTTLLNVLAARTPSAGAHTQGTVLVNGTVPPRPAFRRMSRFVEQEDALIGALTVRETLAFASRLATTRAKGRASQERIDGLLDAFGLREQAGTLVGTALRKGISGGQKRRVGIASQLLTGPQILFLDEPTSGLDSWASWEVMNYLKDIARRNKLIVVASIHQPSTSTFNLFDKLLLLSGGQTHYFGPVADVATYYESIGHALPLHVNPAEFLLEQANADFAADPDRSQAQRRAMQQTWAASSRARQLAATVSSFADVNHDEANKEHQQAVEDEGEGEGEGEGGKPGFASVVLTLLHRSFLKSYRDVIAYGVRMAMYLGLAIMMGTVWVRLETEQEYIQPYINALFFGGAFMSFMAVAYVPAFLEDRNQYVKDFHNGLYGAGALLVSNFLVGIPYLFLLALGFSAVSYWLSNFAPTATAFCIWVLWVFLDLLAAEGLVVLVASLCPHFVVALALVAFANGLWMCVDGFLVSPKLLNVFYRYVFSYWDYQKYVFEGMMVNEFAGRSYGCGDGCRCMYQTELADQCRISGQGVLDQYGYAPGYLGKNVGIMVGIIAGYRIAAWLALMWRR